MKIPFVWRVDNCPWALRLGFGRGRSDKRRLSVGGEFGVYVYSGVLWVLELSQRSEVLRRWNRRKLASVSVCGLRARSWQLVVRDTVKPVVQDRSKRSKERCHDDRGAGSMPVP